MMGISPSWMTYMHMKISLIHGTYDEMVHLVLDKYLTFYWVMVNLPRNIDFWYIGILDIWLASIIFRHDGFPDLVNKASTLILIYGSLLLCLREAW